MGSWGIVPNINDKKMDLYADTAIFKTDNQQGPTV